MSRYLKGIPNTPAPYRDDLGRFTKRVRIHCDSCQMLSINGIPCHEIGCCNRGKVYDTKSETWTKLVECPNCGFEYYDTASDCPECHGLQYCCICDSYGCTTDHAEEEFFS